MKALLALLVIANLALYGWFHGWLAPYGGDGREPQRMARQVLPERLRIVPGSSGPDQDALASSREVSASGDEAPGSQGNADSPKGGALLPMPPESPSASALQGASPPAAWVAAGCVELAPLSEGQALAVQGALGDQSLLFTMLLPAGTETWWVYVWPPQGQAQARFEALRARRLIDEVVLMREGALRGAIVLGRFRDVSNALALQRKLLLAGETQVRLAARGGPPATTLLRMQAADSEELKRAAGAGTGPLVLARMPFSEAGALLIERQREALAAGGSSASLRACPADQAATFSSRR
jgi:hypothetical protein